MATAISTSVAVIAVIGFFFWLFRQGRASAIAAYIADENQKLERIHEERRKLVEKHEKKKSDTASGDNSADPSAYWR